MSAISPRPRSVRIRVYVLGQSMDSYYARTCPGNVLELSVDSIYPRSIPVADSLWLFFRQQISKRVSALFQFMSSFDPSIVRKAVEEFTPGRPQRFQDLMPAKDVIKELRQKRASYRAIATLLTKHCLPTSKTAIAAFCHQMLGEIVRPHRRSGRRRTTATAQANGEELATLEQQPAGEHSPTEAPAGSNGGEAPSARVRGPRIAQVRMLKPEST